MRTLLGAKVKTSERGLVGMCTTHLDELSKSVIGPLVPEEPHISIVQC